MLHILHCNAGSSLARNYSEDRKLQQWFNTATYVTLEPNSYSRRILNDQVQVHAIYVLLQHSLGSMCAHVLLAFILNTNLIHVLQIACPRYTFILTHDMQQCQLSVPMSMRTSMSAVSSIACRETVLRVPAVKTTSVPFQLIIPVVSASRGMTGASSQAMQYRKPALC